MIDPYPVWELHQVSKAQDVMVYQMLSLLASGVAALYAPHPVSFVMWIVFGMTLAALSITFAHWRSANKVVLEWKKGADAEMARRADNCVDMRHWMDTKEFRRMRDRE